MTDIRSSAWLRRKDLRAGSTTIFRDRDAVTHPGKVRRRLP
jgi:hypothetical protein